MNVIRADNYQDMSQKAAAFLIQHIRQSPRTTLGLATGGTPIGTYRELVKDHREQGTSYRGVTTVNLDEYVGLEEDHPNSYRYYMENHLFREIDIDRHQTYLPDGRAEDLAAECQRYETLIRKVGGIDLQVLGIGRNGHIGFNEPGTPLHSRTHVVTLTSSTRQANARYFPSEEEMPTQAITMGIATILDSRQILLLASGEDKAPAIQHLLEGKPNPDFPASALIHHPRVTIVADNEALSGATLVPS
ncbi:glucosamine-6-phosphate deaminase [Salinithrix halophila]|uniref:Glucosamine-6-phosphate deaminase n=1 Tax=Salinithrix halophila TaxID=1485204 RepID=A0ABV8JDA6_9BACL